MKKNKLSLFKKILCLFGISCLSFLSSSESVSSFDYDLTDKRASESKINDINSVIYPIVNYYEIPGSNGYSTLRIYNTINYNVVKLNDFEYRLTPFSYSYLFYISDYLNGSINIIPLDYNDSSQEIFYQDITLNYSFVYDSRLSYSEYLSTLTIDYSVDSDSAFFDNLHSVYNVFSDLDSYAYRITTTINLYDSNLLTSHSIFSEQFSYDYEFDFSVQLMSLSYFYSYLVNPDYYISYQDGVNSVLNNPGYYNLYYYDYIVNNPKTFGLYSYYEYLSNYNNGYNAGQNSSIENNGFKILIDTIFRAPVTMFNNAFDFEIFGINFKYIVSVVLSIGVVLLVIGIFKRF